MKPVGHEAVAALERANRALRGESEWQDIENAPRDGTEILVWSPKTGRLVVSFDEYADPGFPWITLDGPDYWVDVFLCWQPLPPEPATD